MDTAALVAELKKRNINAFKQFFELYYNSTYSAVFFVARDSAIAEDATQEAFITAWEKIAQLQDDTKLSAWITRIALNKSKDALRKRSKEVFADMCISSDDGDPPDVVAEKKVDIEMVRNAISNLPEDVRQVFFLRYYKGMSLQEIAEFMELPEGTVKSKIHRGKKFIKDFMERKTLPGRHNIKSTLSREVKF